MEGQGNALSQSDQRSIHDCPPKMRLVYAALYRPDGDAVPVGAIREYVWQQARISYDQTNHYLRQLVRFGLVEKPSRGNYRAVVR